MFGKNDANPGLPGSKQPQVAGNEVLIRIAEDYAVSYTHLTLPTTPYV